MTSKICSEAKFFSATLRRQTGITLLGTAFSLLLAPGLSWQNVKNVWQDYGRYDLRSEITINALVIFLIALAIGVVLQCYQHGYLFSKKSADLYCALPIRRDSLMAIRFGASVVGAVFSMTASFAALAVLNALPSVIGCAFGDLAKLYGECVLLLILCMSTVQIFVVVAGSVFNFIFSAAVVCVGLPILALIGYAWYAEAAFGVQTSYEWLFDFSPFLYAVSALTKTLDKVDFAKDLLGTAEVLFCAGGSLIFLAVSFVLHHFRKAERAGSGFAYPAMSVLIAVIASCIGGYLIGLLFGASNQMSFWLWFCVGATLASITAGVIISKGFRKLNRWGLCAAAALAVMLGLSLVSNSVGRSDKNYVPKVEKIASVTINGNVTLTDEFEKVTALHAQAIAQDGNHTYNWLVPSDLHISYTLKNGETVDRTYWISGETALKMMLEIIRTEAYGQAWLEEMRKELDSHYLYLSSVDETVAFMGNEEILALLEIYAKELQEADAEALWEETMSGENCQTLLIETASLYNSMQNYRYVYLVVPLSFSRTLEMAERLMEENAVN